MILQIYAVFDRAVGAYMQPFFARSEGEAIRMIRQAVNTPDTALFTNPSDYTLAHLGDFSDQTGVLVASGPTQMINLSSLASAIAPPPDPKISNS